MPPGHRPPRDRARGAKAVANCLALGALADRARALDALDGRLRHLLPAAVARETRLADFRDGRLVFLASSPTWALRIRLSQAGLLSEARAALGGEVEGLTVKVAPLPDDSPSPTARKPLSKATARHLRAAAEAVSDPGLRARYLKLASLAEP